MQAGVGPKPCDAEHPEQQRVDSHQGRVMFRDGQQQQMLPQQQVDPINRDRNMSAVAVSTLFSTLLQLSRDGGGPPNGSSWLVRPNQV